MFAQDALYQHPQPGAGTVAVSPIDADISLEPLEQFMGDDLQLVIAKHINRTLVIGQRVIEGDFLRCQPSLFAPVAGIAEVFCKRDEFLQHLNRADGVRVIAGNGRLKPFRKLAGLNHVGSAARPDFVVQQLAQRLQGQILLRHLPDFGQKLIRQDRDVRRG